MKYLYCLVRGTRIGDEFPLGVDRTAIASISVREIVALVGDVKGDLQPPKIADVLAHHAVVNHALACFPTVLPCRFGTTTSNQAEAIALLEGRYPQLMESLDFLQCKVEIGLKVLLPATVSPRDDNSGERRRGRPAEGMRYLLLRRAQHHRRQDLEAQIEHLTLSLQAAMSPFIQVIKVERSAQENGLMLTLNCLLNRTQLEPFKQRYDQWRAQYAELHMLYTGPWPPYTFAAVDLRQDGSPI